MGRNIRVTGKGKLFVKPDTICLEINITNVYPDYEETIRESAKQTHVLREALRKSGLPGKDLKPSHFSIQTEYESYRDHNDDYKKRFIGYRFTHHAEIRFASDNQQLGRALYELSHCPIETEVSIRYTVLDQEEMKEELLRKAVSDSRRKAKILTEESGVDLGAIEQIDYSWGELAIYSNPIKDFALKSHPIEFARSYDIDIEAEDLELNDTVTIIWEIK